MPLMDPLQWMADRLTDRVREDWTMDHQGFSQLHRSKVWLGPTQPFSEGLVHPITLDLCAAKFVDS